MGAIPDERCRLHWAADVAIKFRRAGGQLNMTGRRRTQIKGFGSGVIAGLFMVLLMLALRYFTGASSLPELILDRGAPFMPIPVFFSLLNFFGGYSHLKEIGVLSTLIGLLGFAGIVGAVYAVKIERARSRDGIPNRLAPAIGPAFSSSFWFC